MKSPSDQTGKKFDFDIARIYIFWWQITYLCYFICVVLHRPCSTGRFFFSSRPQRRTAHWTKAQEISMGWWRVLVMPKSMSISMLLESCHRSIRPLHRTFIRFKSTDMCLPVDWLWAIFSCSGPVPLQCLGCVNGKIKHFFTRKIWTPRPLAFSCGECLLQSRSKYGTIHILTVYGWLLSSVRCCFWFWDEVLYVVVVLCAL